MLNLSGILALAIGLFFVYLLLSAITSYITEAVSTIFRLRAKNLADAIQMLFEPSTQLLNSEKRLDHILATDDEEGAHSSINDQNILPERFIQLNGNLLKAFYEHPIIMSLSKPNRHPSYISAQDFSITLLDLLMDSKESGSLTPDQYLHALKNNINCLNDDMRRTLMPLIQYAELTESNPDKRIIQVRQQIDQWYLSTIERASGWYKNRVQKIGLLVGFLIACLLNADTINIVQYLWENTTARQGLVQAAQEYQQINGPTLENTIIELSQVNFPLGWRPLVDRTGNLDVQYESLKNPIGIFSKLMGFLITALAISVGSSIWFDILNRVINLRSTGTKPANTL
jgi:hypothetical protein